MNIWGDGNVLYNVFSGSYLSTFIKCTICGGYICYIYVIIKIHLIMYLKLKDFMTINCISIKQMK